VFVVNIEIITIVLIVGITGWMVPLLTLSLLHKLKKKNSFVINEKENKTIIKHNPINAFLNPISLFFLTSLFGILLLATDVLKVNVYAKLAIIYMACAAWFFVQFSRRKKFKIVIDKTNNSIVLKNKTYSLQEYNQFEIDDRRRFWESSENLSYALYIKNDENRYQLVYGYSVYEEIEKLKIEIEERMISRY